MYLHQGRSQDLARANITFSDREICMSQSDMLRMEKPYALLEGFGQGRQTGGGGGGGWGGSQPPLNFGWGVEHLSTTPDFEKKNFRGGGGGWLPLN